MPLVKKKKKICKMIVSSLKLCLSIRVFFFLIYIYIYINFKEGLDCYSFNAIGLRLMQLKFNILI